MITPLIAFSYFKNPKVFSFLSNKINKTANPLVRSTSSDELALVILPFEKYFSNQWIAATVSYSFSIDQLPDSAPDMTFNILHIAWPTFPSCPVAHGHLQHHGLQREGDYVASTSCTNHGTQVASPCHTAPHEGSATSPTLFLRNVSSKD